MAPSLLLEKRLENFLVRQIFTLPGIAALRRMILARRVFMEYALLGANFSNVL